MTSSQKTVSVKDMFPNNNDLDSLMNAFDKFQEQADGTDIKKICNKSKEFLATLGVNSEFLPFYFMKRMIDKAIEDSEKKNNALDEANELVEKFEKDDVKNIEPIVNDDEKEGSPQESETENQNCSAPNTNSESDAESNADDNNQD